MMVVMVKINVKTDSPARMKTTIFPFTAGTIL